MSESLRMWIEVAFNISYLVVIWGLVITMVRRRAVVTPERRGVARSILWAFALLALGDTGHVGFRVIAYGLGGLEIQPVVLGVPLSLWIAPKLLDSLPLDTTIEFSYPPSVILMGLIGVILFAAVASLWPSIAASRKTVSDILRYQ